MMTWLSMIYFTVWRKAANQTQSEEGTKQINAMFMDVVEWALNK